MSMLEKKTHTFLLIPHETKIIEFLPKIGSDLLQTHSRGAHREFFL